MVSLLSAIYARWSVNEAKRANEISLHAMKVAIYEEVVSFSDCFRGFFTVPSYERLQQFQKNAVQRAEIYLSSEAHQKLVEIFSHCSESEMWLSIAQSESEDNRAKPNKLEVLAEYKAVLNLLYPAIEQIKNEAKIESA